MNTLWGVELRLSAFALALFALVGCDSAVENAPEEGSCQAMVDDLLDDTFCDFELGRAANSSTPESPDANARCAAVLLELEEGGELSSQVAYQALCDVHGNTAVGYCDMVDQIGCEG